MFYVSSEKLKPTKNVKGCTHLFVVHTCTVLMTTLAHLHICTWSHLHMITLAHLHLITLALSSWSNIIVIKGVPPLIGTRLARRLGEEWRYCDSPLSIFLSTPQATRTAPPSTPPCHHHSSITFSSKSLSTFVSHSYSACTQIKIGQRDTWTSRYVWILQLKFSPTDVRNKRGGSYLFHPHRCHGSSPEGG